MGLWVEIRRIQPKGASPLRVLVVLLALLQLAGWGLLLSSVLGGWPPHMPGGGGIYTQAAKSLVSSAQETKPPTSTAPKSGIFRRSLENLFRIQREVADAGTRAAVATVEVALELSFRIVAFSTGLVMILTGGWVRRKAASWLLRLDLRATESVIRDMDERIARLEKMPRVRGISSPESGD